MLTSPQERILEACGAKEQHVRGATVTSAFSSKHICLLFSGKWPSLSTDNDLRASDKAMMYVAVAAFMLGLLGIDTAVQVE